MALFVFDIDAEGRAQAGALDQEAARGHWRWVHFDLAAPGTVARVGQLVSEEAAELGEEVIQMAEENKAVVGGVVAALVLWLARGPIGRLLGWDETEERD